MKKMLIAITTISAVTAIALPGAAIAAPDGPPVSTCQTLPVATPGITILGQRVPAAKDVTACVVSNTAVAAIPVMVEQPECGSPCFTVEIEGLTVSANVGVVVRFKRDGQQEEISHETGPLGADPGPGSNLCVIGVGTPDPCTDRVTTPKDLTALAKARKAGSRIDLTWGASKATRKSTVVGYQVWRSLTGQPGSFEQIGASTTTAFSDTAITRDTTYWYYVVAWDDAGRYSPASNTASATAR
jgi:hypothetical protein